MALELLNTAAEAASYKFGLDPAKLPATIIASGLAGVETADIQVTQDNGANWVNAYDSNGQVQLTATLNTIGIFSPGTYRINKAATVGAVKVSLSYQSNL